MSVLKTYDSKSVMMVFAGIPITGLAEDTFVNVVRNEESFALMVGADGEGARAKTNNRSGRVTFTVMQTSDCNDQLSALHILDENSSNGDGIGPLLIKDNSGRTLITAEKAWIVKTPDAALGKNIQTREWVIESHALVMALGGN